MSDRGGPMLSGEFGAGLHRLAILHVPTLPYSPHVNGKQENLWARVEGRLLAMLEGEPNLSLEQLNVATQAWVTQEYHRTVHSERFSAYGSQVHAGADRQRDGWRTDQRWMTFVRNHAEAVVACDFFTVVTATFKVPYVFVVVTHATRRIVHFNVTDSPTADWALQQLRGASRRIIRTDS